ncbi:breast cancer type 2 susceptibility protein homolog [Spodoptera frugiperda]|uniref:Breast cancer type 2 susceptibility protein homolog n=1 Tax=Spodoptera frugiperda TaxID=7108 RepID=A0A9R0DJ43_SPOFR|nr:breast cancer type 2 susceptibility protein homolog [Spodoptera frugiperda]
MSDSLQNFELILQKSSKRPSLGLYKDNKQENKHTYKPQDVISSVSLQLKAFQVADSVKSEKCKPKVLPKCKNSDFLSVSNLPVYDEPQKSKFDTQYATDTQLINIIEDAEIIDIHHGMTQEFETTFCHHTEKVLDEADDEKNREDKDGCLDDDTVDDRVERDTEDVNNDNNVEMDTSVSLISPIINSNRVKYEEPTINSGRNKDFGAEKQNIECIEINDDDLAIEMPLSPIFIQKVTKPKSKTPSPMVFSLEKFEEFEKLSEPVLIGDDLKISKKIINSQILDKELNINMDEEIALNARSPVLQNKPKRKINKEFKTKLLIDPTSEEDIELINLDKATTDNLIKEVTKGESRRLKEVLKDEILFSSDEEDLVQESLQDLPFTCALETSFYDQSDVLDKTMYVGFQTASNKSILISTDSFAQAKSILGDVEDDVTITEMVKNCESNVKNTTNNEKQGEMDSNDKKTEFKFISGNEIDKVVDTGQPDSGSFKGFMTASNKQIRLSQKALVRSKKVFQDIDLNEDFDKRTVEDDDNAEESEKYKEDKLEREDRLNIEEEIQNIDDALIQEFENIEMSLNDDKKEVGVKGVAPIGFRTASNKEIEITDTALAKIKDVFKDIDLDEDLNELEFKEDNFENKDLGNIGRDIKSTTEIGFKTASNKNIHISKEAISKTKNIFQDLDDIKFPIKLDKVLNKNEGNTSEINSTETKADFVGFKTASNKNIKISEEALAKTKNLFQDIDDTELPNKKTEENFAKEEIFAKPSTSKGFTGFKTANNKQINVSKAALAKTKRIFEDIDSVDFKIPNKREANSKNLKETEDLTSESSFTGFKTASNKNIKISNEAMARTEQVFKDIDSENFSHPKQSTKTEENTKFNTETSKTGFVGFKTANNKEIKISEKALAETKNMFKDIDDTNFKYPSKHVKTTENDKKDDSKAKTTDLYGPSTSKALFVGFQTGNNKKVNISKEALVKTRNIFKDILENDPKSNKKPEENTIDVETEDFNKPSTSKASFIGFQTANNKKITISKESLAKTKDIFKDINEIDLGETSKGDDDTEIAANEPDKAPYPLSTNKTSFIGFKTANNKQIHISKESLAKTKNIFKDIDSNDVTNANNLDKGEEKLPYPSLEEDLHPMKSLTGFVGFKTANNKVINVSEKALAKTKNIFKDLEETVIDSTNITKKDYPDIEIGTKECVSNKDGSATSIKDNNFKINTNKMPKFQGFQTASNKKVAISAEALLKSRKIFENIDANEDMITKNLKTGSMNNLNLAKDDRAQKNEPNLDIDKSKSPIFKGFQTGNKKPVPISEEALARSRKLFQDLETMQDEPEPAFHGFKTTNNNELELSQKALIDAVNIFEKELQDGSQFQTVNEKVKINKDCLHPRLLKELEGSENKKRNDVSKIKPNSDVNKIDNGVRNKRPFTEVDTSNNKITDLDEGLENIINTQVLNNFDQSLHTEDFRETPVKAKRPSSPILSCPKAKKRRKFETPYSQKLPVLKKKEIIKPNEGNKIKFKENYKRNKEYTLKDLDKMTRNFGTKIDSYLTKFRFDSLLQFVFKNERNDLTDSDLTIESLKEYFSNSVNCKLIPKGWLDNHLKLILWKLISYEIKFNHLFCTARNVVDQLKFRYDVELFNAKRPALRKIFEKDDVPSKTIVLCVAEIYQDGVSVISASTTNNMELLLTDGWYCIKANIDKMLAQHVCRGKIVVGTKLVTNGAELVGCEQGVSPWEDTTAIRLKLFGNSTRRARWDARLGYHGNAAILSQLSSVKIDGGKVSKLRVFVTRVYPALYVEKFEDGSTVTRSERLEHLHQVKTEAERQAVMERIYEEVEREFSDQESQDSESFTDSCHKRVCLDSGSQIAKVMKRSRDPEEFRAGLTSTQTRLLEGHTSKQRDRLLQDVQKRVREKMEKAGVQVNRNVVMLLKIRVAGVVERSGVEISKGMMSIWKPTDAVTDMIKEGVWMDVLNVVPTAVRYNEIQISAGRQSIFSLSKFKEPEALKPYTKTLQRISYTIHQLVQNPSMSTDYNEIDTIGFIFLIDPPIHDFDSTKQPFQNIYLSDAYKNIICINFWGGLKKFGYENVLDTGQIIYCGNLQKRAGNTRKSIPQYRVTEFTYFTKTPKNECARNLIHDLSKKFCSLDRRKFCEDCVVLKNNFAIVKSNNENISPYRFNNSDHNFSKNKMFIDSPLARPVKDDFNLTGLDFESTFRQTDTQNLSEEVLLRKKKVNEKIARLKMYGEPPPLSTIHIINRSKNASNSYKSPLNPNQSNISKIPPKKSKSETVKSDSCDNVASVKETPEKSGNLNDSDLVCSPVLMNRTYVKNVNPVKINFDVKDNNDSNVDHFAEEFDGSPPLSLD